MALISFYFAVGNSDEKILKFICFRTLITIQSNKCLKTKTMTEFKSPTCRWFKLVPQGRVFKILVAFPVIIKNKLKCFINGYLSRKKYFIISWQFTISWLNGLALEVLESFFGCNQSTFIFSEIHIILITFLY